MGNPSTGSQRLSMAGGINNFGTTIGPLLISIAIFGKVSSGASSASIESVKTPYLILGLAFVIMALFLKFSSVPNKINLHAVEEKSARGEAEPENRRSVFQYPQLWMGMIAIFVYVGVEVATASNLPEYMRQYLHVETANIAPFVSLYWASLMIGRWASSVGAFGLNESYRRTLSFIVPFLAFAVFLIVNIISGHRVEQFYVYGIVIISMIIGDILSKGNPAKMLLILSCMGITALLVGMFTNGMISAFAFISVGLFCSTLWPCIFTLAIAGLGKHTNQGSSLLIMMIMGGGIISLLQGWLASDRLLGIQYSYLTGVACFIYLAFYAIRVSNILQKQGISYNNNTKISGH